MGAGLVHPGQPHHGSYDSVCTEISTVAMITQLLVASEFLIFPVRALSFMWTSRACTSLYVAVISAAILFSVLAALGVPKNIGASNSHGLGDVFSQALGWANFGWCWLWSLCGCVLMDFVKYAWVLQVDGTVNMIENERVDITKKLLVPEAGEGPAAMMVRKSVGSTAAVRTTMGGIGNLHMPAGAKTPGALAAAMARASKRTTMSGY